MTRAADDRTLNAMSAGDLAVVIDRNLIRARSLGRSLAGDLAFDRNLALDLASALNVTLARAHALESLLGLPRALVADLALAHLLADNLARDSERARDLARYKDLHDALALAASRANEVVRVLGALAPDPTSLEPVNQPIEPARWAQHLAQAAVRVLPVADRARYSDECRSELYELAAAGVSRSRQLLYAVRLLDRAWVLRAELRAPASRRARA